SPTDAVRCGGTVGSESGGGTLKASRERTTSRLSRDCATPFGHTSDSRKAQTLGPPRAKQPFLASATSRERLPHQERIRNSHAAMQVHRSSYSWIVPDHSAWECSSSVRDRPESSRAAAIPRVAGGCTPGPRRCRS